jgi:hypothetical protein
VSGYLSGVLARAAGDPAPVRLRPASRFEGTGGGLELHEEVVRPDAPRAPRRREPPAVVASAARDATDASRRPSSKEIQAPSAPAAAQPRLERETVRQRSETTHASERIVERNERVLEQVSSRTERIVQLHETPGPVHETKVVVHRDALPIVSPPAGVAGNALPPERTKTHARVEPSPHKERSEIPGRFEVAAPVARAERKLPEAGEPEVTISIGRLDIRLVREPEAPRRAQEPAARVGDATPSLRDYLNERSRGRR